MLQRAEQKLFANAVVMQDPGNKPAKGGGDEALGLKDL